MPFIHNRNKHGREWFTIEIAEHNEKFSVAITRKVGKGYRYYQPGLKSIARIQNLLDSSQFNKIVRIEACRSSRELNRPTQKFYDFILIEIA